MSDETPEESGVRPRPDGTGHMLLAAIADSERRTMERLDAIGVGVQELRLEIAGDGMSERPGLKMRVRHLEDRGEVLGDEIKTLGAKIKGQGSEVAEVRLEMAQVKKTLEEEETWRRQIKMWIAGGVIGVIVVTVLGTFGKGLLATFGG